MNQYDIFANHYDSVVGDREEVAVFLQRLLREYAPRAKTLLELGCGSGSMLKLLTRRYQACGIDSSSKMIGLARKKAPKARLLVADITDFNLKQGFDAVICPFDTINHITSFRDWKRVFSHAHAHLNRDGVFIFDINTEVKLERYATEPVFAKLVENDVAVVDVRRVRRFRYVVNLRLLKHTQGSTYRNYGVLIPELVVPTPKILAELSKYFKRVTLIDPDRKAPCAESEELFFVCHGPR